MTRASYSLWTTPYRGIAVTVTLLAILAAPPAVDAQRKHTLALSTAMVRVLDSTGSPVPGVEVELLVTRGDGTADRRLGTSGGDGQASFDDVRTDCVDIQAAALLPSGRVDSKVNNCDDELELFIVLPPACPEALAAVGGMPRPEAASPALAETTPAQAAVEAPVAPAGPVEPTAPSPPKTTDAPPAPPPEQGRIAIAWRAGVGLCQEWFYRPGPKDPTCDDDVSPGLDLEIDGGWHVTDWLSIGPRLGYWFFRSDVKLDLDDDDSNGVQVNPALVRSGEVNAKGAVHRLHWGIGARALWMPGRLVLGADLMPLALLHGFTRIEKTDNLSFTEFVISAGVVAGLRIDRSWWLGVQARFLQVLPWIESTRFLPGSLVLGLMLGYRFDKSGSDDGRPAPARRQSADEPADPDSERRRHFMELQQERSGF